MEKKDQDLIKKVAKLVEESKRKKITDFDSGLLQESFEPIVGTARERYELWCKRLLNISTRLENMRITTGGSLDDEKYSILKEIAAVLTKEPPDVLILGGQGNTMIACRGKTNGKTVVYGERYFCDDKTFEKTLEVANEKQYFNLISCIKQLEYKARSRLESFKWHKDDAIKDISSVKEEKT